MHNLGSSHAVKFTYFGHSGEKPDPYEHPWGATCEVYRIVDGEDELLAWGNSYCADSDNWRYAIGRKLALAKALLDYEYCIDKEERTKIWEEYFKVFPKDRMKVGK